MLLGVAPIATLVHHTKLGNHLVFWSDISDLWRVNSHSIHISPGAVTHDLHIPPGPRCIFLKHLPFVIVAALLP